MTPLQKAVLLTQPPKLMGAGPQRRQVFWAFPRQNLQSMADFVEMRRVSQKIFATLRPGDFALKILTFLQWSHKRKVYQAIA